MLISVIVPFYDDTYLGECLESITRQDYPATEMIVVHDREGRGPSWARNQGLERATGDRILFLDGDDYLYPHAVSTLAKHDADMVVGDFFKMRGEVFASGQWAQVFGDTLLDEAGIRGYVAKYLRKQYRFILFSHVWGRLYRRDIIDAHNLRFDEQLWNLEDVDFNFRYLQCAKTVQYVDSVVCAYRIHGDSLGSRVGEKVAYIDQYKRAFRSIAAYWKDEEAVAHAYVSHMVTALIRTCRTLRWGNIRSVYAFVRAMVRDADVRRALGFYLPTGMDNRLIPYLMRFRAVIPLMWVCRRAYR